MLRFCQLKIWYSLVFLFLPILLYWRSGQERYEADDFSGASVHIKDISSQTGKAQLIYHNNIGIALLEQFNHEQALVEFSRCLSIEKDFLPALINSALAYFYLKHFPQAEKLLQQALDQDSQQPTALFIMGLIYKNQNKLDLALDAFKKILLQDPSDPPTLYQVGQLQLKKQDFNQAEYFLRKVVKLSPYDTAAHYNLAMSLLRKGNRMEGKKVMSKFKQLREQGGISSTGIQYGEQGKYMLASGEHLEIKDLLPSPTRVSDLKPIYFKEVSKEVGIVFKHTSKVQEAVFSRSISATAYTPTVARQWVSSMGSGAAFGDYNNDGYLDLYLANSGPDPTSSQGVLYHNDGNGRFSDVTAQAGIQYQGLGMGAYWGDFDNDGQLDLFLSNYGPNILYHNNGNGSFSDVTAAAGVAGCDHWHLSAALADYDHDGNLDLYLGHFADLSRKPSGDSFSFPDDFEGRSSHLYRNNGNGTFTDVAKVAKVLASGDKLSSVVFTDFDNRRDVDFWTVGQGGKNRLYSNQRVGTFLDIGKYLNALGSLPSQSVSTADLDKDGRTDFLLVPERGALLWVRNLGQKNFQVENLPSPHAGSGIRSWMSHAFDYDNDGDLDILEIRGSNLPSSHSQAGPELYENQSSGKFQRVTAKTGLDQYKGKAFRSATFGDYDNDGDTDFLLTVNGDRPLLLRNEGGNQNRWVKIRLRGTNSNKSGIGTKVEVKSGTLWQKIEVNGGTGYLAQNPSEVLFGLGQRTSVDALRLLWPGGVLQSETNLPVNRVRLVHELDRKGTSCPILYAWNGHQYQFVTDFLGGCAIGYLLGPGQYNTPDTDEYVKITQSQLKVRDGKYSLRINNQLEEVLYIDQTELVILDHPSEIELFPNERLMPAPPYPKFKIYATRDTRSPTLAIDETGKDVLPLIKQVDRRYPDDFGLLPFKGYAEEHSLILDLGDLAGSNQVNLLMTAWIDYANSTSNFQASKAGVKLIPPYIQVKNQQGQWQTVIPDMGFPAGLPKTMIVDLTGKFLVPDYQIRLVTSMRIYWDQILINTYSDSPTFRQYRLSPQSADLRFHGFPREYSPDGRRPLIYDYNWTNPTAPWKSHIGSYTRFGPVTNLLQTRDDMYVIMRNGDEIHLDYDASDLPELPQGWQRTFLLYADGFGKDMDLHSATHDFVTPLPFHDMSQYPYDRSEQYPDSPYHRHYHRVYNTRHISDVQSDIRTVRNVQGSDTIELFSADTQR